MEISVAYKYCPICGAKREHSQPSRPFRCEHCGHTSFFGPVTAVGCVVTNVDGKVLVIRRAKEPGLGKLGLPGGFVDPNESAEEALHREVLEEVGLKVKELQFLMTAPNRYVYRNVESPVLDIFYTALVEEDREIVTQDGEVSDWMWTEISDHVLEQFAFESNRIAMQFYRQRVSDKQ